MRPSDTLHKGKKGGTRVQISEYDKHWPDHLQTTVVGTWLGTKNPNAGTSYI